MTSALKRSYPFGSRPSSLVEEANHQFKVPQIPVHKKMSVASPSINVSTENASNTSSPFSCMSSSMSPSSMSSWRLNNNKTSARQDTSISFIIVPDNNDPVTQINGEKSPLPSPPSSKGRRNMKNLQLVVPPVRSAISAPSSPQLPQMSSTHTHSRRPSTPICIFQNKNHDGSNTAAAADPMALMSKTENAIGEDLPYKDEPILILPNLYLGSELNAANRTMLNRLNIEFILNVGKEVENPYLDEIIKHNSPNNDNENSPCFSDCSDDSFKTAIQSPLNAFKDLDSPMASPLFGGFSSIQKRSSMSRPTSISLQLAKNEMQSGVPLTVPSTSEFNSIKYKKFFWTHNQENLISDFSSAFSFIDEARSYNRNILVHCQCGVSRSASLIIGYVMEANKMTLNQAYEFVKDRSPYISPNMSLVYQLVDFEKILKLGSKNHNNALPGTPTKTTNRPSHSRSPSIESDLLLKTHRRSSSISRNNPVLSIVPVQSSSESLSSPKTPTVVSEGGTANLSQQSTVKGGPGRFHVITASTTSVTPSTLSPASSVSPTSTASPTTPSSEPSSPTTRLRLSSRSPTLSPEISHSSLTVTSTTTTSNRSRSPYSLDRVPLSSKEITNIKTSTKSMSSSFSNVILSNSSNNNNNNNNNNSLMMMTTSNPNNPFASFDSSQPHISIFSNYSLSNGPAPGIFSKSTMESIFSPTRTSPPITPVAIPNVFLDDE